MGTSRHLDLFLVRHGITDWNKEKRYLGHTNRKVLKDELPQLKELKKELMKISFDHVFTSDLRRCQETLAYLNIQSQVSVDTRLREINFGDWEGKTYNELKGEKPYQDWLNNWECHSIPNGESAHVFKARIDSFLYDLFQQTNKNFSNNKQILIVTHGGVIRYLVSKYLTSRSIWDVSVTHGQGIRLTFVRQKGEWVCNSLLEVPFQAKERS